MDQKVDVKSDKLGITSAILCTIHCLVVPVLFLLKISWTGEHTDFLVPGWWELLDYAFLLISFYAVYHSASHTPVKGIKIALWFFWTILAISIIFQATMHWLAYIASAGLVITHLLNIRRMTKGISAGITSRF